MQRIFAFDPGTSAIGWAVLDVEGASIEIIGAGVRLFALSRHRAVQQMRQRLKPEQQMKLRQRMKLRRKDLEKALAACGLISAGQQDRRWERDDGKQLSRWLSVSLTQPLPPEAVVRILFNVHKHRCSMRYGPESAAAPVFAARFLLAQSCWHPVLRADDCRDRLHSIIFRRREPQQKGAGVIPASPLAAIAHHEFTAVWRALVRKYGSPAEVRIEAAIPASKISAPDPETASRLAKKLDEIGRPPTRQNLLRARLFENQSVGDSAFALCPLTGDTFGFADVFSPRVEIDHLRPVSKGGAGGRHNLALCLADANRAKGAKFDIEGVPAHADKKTGRSRADIADADALRQAVRLAADFASQQTKGCKIRLVSPKAVNTARNAWLDGTLAKDRSDLRHHAVDAIVLGALPEGKAGATPPGAGFATAIRGRMEATLVSIKPEQGKSGKLHDETRYGRPSAESGFSVTGHVSSRKCVDELTSPMFKRLADPHLQRLAEAAGVEQGDWPATLFGRAKRVKVVRRANDAIALLDGFGRFTAAVLPTDNHHLDIVLMRDQTWKAFGATRHAVNQKGWRPEWERNKTGGKLVMRLHKGDMLELQGDDGLPNIMTVVRLGASSGLVHLGNHYASPGFDGGEAMEALRRQPRAYAPRSLQKRCARAVTVSAAGDMIYRRSNVDKVRTRLIWGSGPEPRPDARAGSAEHGGICPVTVESPDRPHDRNRY